MISAPSALQKTVVVVWAVLLSLPFLFANYLSDIIYCSFKYRSFLFFLAVVGGRSSLVNLEFSQQHSLQKIFLFQLYTRMEFCSIAQTSETKVYSWLSCVFSTQFTNLITCSVQWFGRTIIASDVDRRPYLNLKIQIGTSCKLQFLSLDLPTNRTIGDFRFFFYRQLPSLRFLDPS